MTDVAADAFRTVGPAAGIPNDFVVPYYLGDRKLRVSVARVGDHLYAFDDLCPCADRACPLSGGLLTGTTIMCQCRGSQVRDAEFSIAQVARNAGVVGDRSAVIESRRNG